MQKNKKYLPWEKVKEKRENNKKFNKVIIIALFSYSALTAVGFLVRDSISHFSEVQEIGAIVQVVHATTEDVAPISIKDQLWIDLDSYGFTLQEKEKTMRLIGECENPAFDTNATYNNGNSIDRGLFMFNDYFHAEVTNACAFNYKCSLDEFVRIYRERGIREWVCGITLGL